MAERHYLQHERYHLQRLLMGAIELYVNVNEEYHDGQPAAIDHYGVSCDFPGWGAQSVGMSAPPSLVSRP